MRENNQRIESLDMFRGLMLVIMTFDHLGGPIKKITFEPIGYVSAAEGFIYISGFVYGLVYTKFFVLNGFSELKKKSFKRAGVIYFYHLLLFFSLITLSLLDFMRFDEFDHLNDNIGLYIIHYLFFLYQPANMDILPIYIVFIILGPFVIRWFYLGYTKWIFMFSFLLYLMGQLPLFNYTSYDLSQYRIELGNFNILSYQFLFFTGCYLGYSKYKGRIEIPLTTRLFVLSSIFFLVFFIARYSLVDSILIDLIKYLKNRSTLGIARLMNFSFVLYILYYLSIRFNSIFKIKWLSFLGRHSLQVFIYSVWIVYIAEFGKIVFQTIYNEYIIPIHLILVFSLILPALLHQKLVLNVPMIKKYGL
jgi:hypothetical protein